MKRFICIALLSMITMCYFAGCNKPTDEHAGHDHEGENAAQTAAEDDHSGHDHAEGAAGPHGGHVLVLGNDAAHAELLHDDAAQKVTVWMTDHAGSPLDAGEAIQLQIFVDGQFVDFEIPKTELGVYEVVSEPLGEALDSSDHLQGRMHATINQQDVVGTINVQGHDHGEETAEEADHDADEAPHDEAAHSETDGHTH